MSTSDIVTILDDLKLAFTSCGEWFYKLLDSTGFIYVILFLAVFGLLFRFVIARTMPNPFSLGLFIRGSDPTRYKRTNIGFVKDSDSKSNNNGNYSSSKIGFRSD